MSRCSQVLWHGASGPEHYVGRGFNGLTLSDETEFYAWIQCHSQLRGGAVSISIQQSSCVETSALLCVIGSLKESTTKITQTHPNILVNMQMHI